MSDVIIKLKRTSSDLSTLTNVLEYGEPTYSTTSKALVIGDGTNQIKALPRFLATEKNIASTLVLKGGGTSAYPSFSALVAADIPNLDASKITSGTLSVARGGTGKASTVAGGVAYGKSSSIDYTAAGTAGQLLSSNGTSAPTWVNASSLAAGSATQDSNGNNIVSTYETKAQVKSKGNSTTPVYFDSSGNAQPLSYTLAKSVPSNAIFTDTTYSAGTGISLSGTTFSNSGVRSITTGTSNGTISVNTNGTASDIAVKGLGTAAYASTDQFLSSSGTAAAATKLAISRSLKVSLSSSSAASFNGTADATSIGVSGTLGVGNGGTNNTSWSNNQLVYSTTTGLTNLGAGTTGQILQSNGSGTVPSWVSVNTDASGITSGVFPVARGGTSKSSWTAGRLVYANTSTSLTEFPAGNTNQVLMSKGSGSAPEWTNLSSLSGVVTNDWSKFHPATTYNSYLNFTCFFDKLVVYQLQFTLSNATRYLYDDLPAEVKLELNYYYNSLVLPYYIIVLQRSIPVDCRPTDVSRVFLVNVFQRDKGADLYDYAQAIVTPSGSLVINYNSRYASLLEYNPTVYACGAYTKTLALGT